MHQYIHTALHSQALAGCTHAVWLAPGAVLAEHDPGPEVPDAQGVPRAWGGRATCAMACLHAPGIWALSLLTPMVVLQDSTPVQKAAPTRYHPLLTQKSPFHVPQLPLLCAPPAGPHMCPLSCGSRLICVTATWVGSLHRPGGKGARGQGSSQLR